MSKTPALIFDLDGTLLDSVYHHVLAWRMAFREVGIDLSIWRIHRKIGMSGGLFEQQLMREMGEHIGDEVRSKLRRLHAKAYQQQVADVRPLPGTRALLARLTELAVPWAIATSGRLETAGEPLERLGLPAHVPIVTRDAVANAKPNPDLFLEAIRRLDVDAAETFVIGDSVWDMLAARRAHTLSVGVLSGGYGQEELQRAGAYRVYEDPQDVLAHLDEMGIRG